MRPALRSKGILARVARQKGNAFFNTQYRNKKKTEIMIRLFLMGSHLTAGRAKSGYGIQLLCFRMYARDDKHNAVLKDISICFLK
jgi:hypothetical protein